MAIPSTRQAKPCRIHPQVTHPHQAVCSTCMQPLNPQFKPTCWHPAAGAYINWRCVA